MCVPDVFSLQHQHYRDRIIRGDPTGRFYVHLNVQSGILSKGDLSCSHEFTLHITYRCTTDRTSIGRSIVN